MQLTKEQRRALNTEQKRQQRAREGQLVAPTQQFMAELARYDLPLVQLLMAEYALNPANAGAPGRMRLHFLEQYAATCHTKHAEPAASAQVLDVLAAVLRAHRADGGSRPRRPPRSQHAAALQLAGTAREDSARLRRTEPPALWTL